MNNYTAPTRRDLIRAGFAGAGVIALDRFSPALFAAGEPDDATIPFIDPQPIDPKRPMVKWQDLRDWITPQPEFFAVSHYGPAHVSTDGWKLRAEGCVRHELEWSLDQLRSRPKKEITATLECSGNGAGAGFMGAIGNARWAGASLADLLKEAGVKPEAIEVAFWGADSGKEKIRNKEYEQNFARSLSLDDANKSDVLVAWEMNGKPLPAGHGFPLRLIVPGWYGIAWVKWLSRIEVRDRRLMNRFMARDYVTIRGHRNGQTIEWTETSVGPLNVKSLLGRVSRRADGSVRITGAAWSNQPIIRVELKIDDEKWVEVELQQQSEAPHAWTFWSYEWKNPPAGEHVLVCRATDAAGRVQPAADDDVIKLKQTYWEANQQYPRKIRL
ncbi:MAG TPA: sulfite oxidase [Tepidisphaeraceae bacterium]|nr:sulfite oxidase [Tepidisphaeraceae bacterium]